MSVKRNGSYMSGKRFAGLVLGRMPITMLIIAIEIFWMIAFGLWLSNYAAWINTFFTVLSLVIVAYLILKDENQSYKLTWIVVVAFLPFFGGMMYLMFGNKRPSRKMRKRLESVEALHRDLMLEQYKLNVCHWFTVDVFDHLKHGGRVSAASAAVGGLLNIKPMLHVDHDGKLGVVKKPRGRNKAIKELIAQMQAGWQPEISPLVVIGHGDDPEAAEKLKQAVENQFPQADIHIAEIGPIIGAHTGPGMLALIYWGNNR